MHTSFMAHCLFRKACAYRAVNCLHKRLPLLISRNISRTSNDAIAPIFQIWGVNTAVGKTVFSAALLHGVNQKSLYIKPVQSGYPQDNDTSLVKSLAPESQALSFFNLAQPVSPDLAARLSNEPPVSDDHLISTTENALHGFLSASALQEKNNHNSIRAFVLVETAGGVLSPTPSGNPQGDVYRPLRLPSILVGDSQLGGISTTLAAYEALRLRGYDVPAVVLFENSDGLENEVSIQRYIDESVTSVFLAPAIPPRPVPLSMYIRDKRTISFFDKLREHLILSEQHRVSLLDSMSERASKQFWYPFTQHASLKKIHVFDSAHGDSISVYDKAQREISNMTDAMGSWWTNGVGHGNIKVAKAMATAAGRYGHVMFAEAVHEPALNVAQRAIDTVGSGWASRVFFSDNGSTAVEVALKMGFRKRATDYPSRKHLPVHIVGLRNSYHGDTLGVMDCSEPSDYNMTQTPWYQPRGLFLDPPTLALRNGVWTVEAPTWLDGGGFMQIDGVDEAMSKERDVQVYKECIGRKLDRVLHENQIDLGALVIEPVLLGAGGMQMVDLAFQRALVQECRLRGIPIVFDEVFTGFWRLGEISGASILGCHPDIAAYSKLLTGGTVPLAITLSNEDVFRAFDGSSKKDALLHGHSYTAHTVGCAAAVESMREYDRVLWKGNNQYWCEWSARELSSMDVVERVTVVGTVLSVELKGEERGYAATGAAKIVEQLVGERVFTRSLGNVIYLMCSPMTSSDTCQQLSRKLMKVLEGLEGHSQRQKWVEKA